MPSSIQEQLQPSVWTWSDSQAAAALASRELGPILRAYRRVHSLTQEQLASRLGYDKTYVSMMETCRRRVQDVPTRRHLAAVLGIPPRLLGVTDAADSDHAAMVAFADAIIRLADLARAAGRSAAAVGELWPLVARLEARAAEGHLEADTLAVLGRAWMSLGVCLGTILPEERLSVAAAWTGKSVAAAEALGDAAALPLALAMHGNELRKSGQVPAAVSALQRATATVPVGKRSGDGGDRSGTIAVLLARAAAEAGNRPLFEASVTSGLRLLEAGAPEGLLDPFVLREVRIRGLLDVGDARAAAALALAPAGTPAPAPQWRVIEQITQADVLLASGEADEARGVLTRAVGDAVGLRLPHQVQRAERTATRGRFDELVTGIRAALVEASALPVRLG